MGDPTTSVFDDDGVACANELAYESPLLTGTFRASDNDIEVDYMSSETGFQRRTLTNLAAVQQALSPNRSGFGRRTRVFSIASAFSNGPLAITRSAMQDIVENLNINIDFVQIVSAFGRKPRQSESGLDCLSFKRTGDSFEMTYLFRFIETDPGNESMWTFRQIGVYHRHDAVKNNTNGKFTEEDVFLFLQPHAGSQLDCQLEDIRDNPADVATFSTHPLKLHILLFQTYFVRGWRGYLHYESERFTTHSDLIFTENVDREEGISFHTLREWRNLADNIAPLTAMVDSQSRILECLHEQLLRYNVYSSNNNNNINNNNNTNQSNCTASVTITTLPTSNLLNQAKGFKSSAEVFHSRIDNVTTLLTNTIDMKNQYQAHQLNEHMRSLTQDTVDDSASVRIITVLSLIYIPASFLGTMFGMNFFDFDNAQRRIKVSVDFWIYFLLMLGLTSVTFGFWFVMSRNVTNKRNAREQAAAAAAPVVTEKGALYGRRTRTNTSTSWRQYIRLPVRG